MGPMIVFPANELIELKIGDASFFMKPLTAAEKGSILRYRKLESGVEEVDGFSMALQAIKASLRRVKGLYLPDGSAWVPETNKDGSFTDTSLDTILNMGEASAAMIQFVNNLLQGDFNLDRKGVEILYKGTSLKKKRRK